MRRESRLAEEIQHVVMELIPYGLDDPRVETTTVTKVQLSADLKLARIYVDVGGDMAAKKKALRALDHARSYLRRELAVQVNIRRIPDLAFFLDQSREYSERVAEILDRIKKDQ